MPPTMINGEKASPFAAILDLLHPALETLGHPEEPGQSATLASPAVHNARRLTLAAVGKLTELASDPSNRLLEFASQYWESRCIFIAAERRLPDMIAETSISAGARIDILSERSGIETRKLGE